MSKTKAIALCIMVIMLVQAAVNLYLMHCCQDEQAANEVLIRENQKLRGHVETLTATSIDMMHKLEAANDRAEALLSK